MHAVARSAQHDLSASCYGDDWATVTTVLHANGNCIWTSMAIGMLNIKLRRTPLLASNSTRVTWLEVATCRLLRCELGWR